MTFEANQLKVLTGDAAYQRGERYFAQKRVQITTSDANGVEGLVAGSDHYHCKLSWKKEILFDCTCPVGDSGDCCKHIVALALAYEEQRQGYAPIYQHPLHDFLKTQSPTWLFNTLCDIADKYPEIARQLNRQRQLSGQIDLTELKKTVVSLVGRPRFLDYRQSRSYAVKLQELGELFQQLLQANQADICLQLSEYALPKLFKVYESSDDSGGYIGGEISYIADCFMQACVVQAPLNAEFSKRLFKLSLEDQWGMINTEQIYPLLSPQAVDAWDSILETEWAKLVVSKTQNDFGYAYQIKLLVEAKAKASGDVARLIQLYSQNLTAFNYLQLIAVCEQYNRGREAVLWAERGVKAYPGHAELGSKLVEVYLRDGLEDEALNVQWQNFVSNSSTQNFLKLRQLSGKDWPKWRTQALNHLVAIESKFQEIPYRFYTQQTKAKDARPFASTRVACLLAEYPFNTNALEEVRTLLKTHGCNANLSLEYARLIKSQYPQESVVILQNLAENQVNQGNNDAYTRGISLINEIRPLMEQANFLAYIGQLKVTFKAKRNFMAMLNNLQNH